MSDEWAARVKVVEKHCDTDSVWKLIGSLSGWVQAPEMLLCARAVQAAIYARRQQRAWNHRQ